MKKIKEIILNEKGNVLVLVALSMVMLMGFTALAVDAGRMYSEKSSLQKSLDAAALAGAQVYYSETEDSKVTAIDVAGSNGFLIEDVDVEVADNYVKVTKETNIPLTFAKILGFDDADIFATATAGVFPLSKSIGIAPIAVEEDSVPDGTFLNCENPGNNTKEVNFKQLIGGNPSDEYVADFKEGYEEGYVDGYDKNSKQTFGSTYSVAFTDGYEEGYDAGKVDGDDIGNKGNCGFLAVDGSGASNLKDAILNGAEMEIGDDIIEDTEPGKSQGPVKQAVEELISRDADSPHCNSFETADNKCNRVITIAVVEAGSFSTISGRDELKIIGFASYWLEGMGTGQDKHRVIGHYIDMVTLGEGEEGLDEKGAYSVKLIE